MVFNSKGPGLSLKGRALRALGQREHARVELERKLMPHAADASELAAVLDELTAKGFISEARVIESVLHQKAAQWGAGRIRQQLRSKGVDEARVEAALADLQAREQGSELARARAVWQRRFGAAARGGQDRPSHPPAATAQEQARQWRFLQSRGFAPEVVRRVLKGAAGDEG